MEDVDLSTLAAAKRFVKPGMKLRVTNHKWRASGSTEMDRMVTITKTSSAGFNLTMPKPGQHDYLAWPKAAAYRALPDGAGFEWLDQIRGEYIGGGQGYEHLGWGEPWITFELPAAYFGRTLGEAQFSIVRVVANGDTYEGFLLSADAEVVRIEPADDAPGLGSQIETCDVTDAAILERYISPGVYETVAGAG